MPPIIEHDELYKEMQDLNKIPITERISLAKKRRQDQMVNYNEWAKSDSADRNFNKNNRNIHFSPEIELIDIASRGSIADMQELLKSGVDPNLANYDGLTALHQCCIDGSVEMVSVLLKAGADINVCDRDLWSPLHAAATCGHLKIVTMLVKAGANLTSVNGDGNMPYDITEDEMTLHFLENYMAKKGITQDKIEETRNKPYKEMKRDIEQIINNGGDLNQPLSEGCSFLHIAISNEYNDLVDLLLQNGASANIKDDDGWEPIHAAAYWNNDVAIEKLTLDKKVNPRSLTALGETPYDLCDDPDIKSNILQLIDEYTESSVIDGYGRESYDQGYHNITSTQFNIDENITDKNIEYETNNVLPEINSNTEQNTNEGSDNKEIPLRKNSNNNTSNPLLNLSAAEHTSDRRSSVRAAKKRASNIDHRHSNPIKLDEKTNKNEVISLMGNKFKEEQITSHVEISSLNSDNDSNYETPSTLVSKNEPQYYEPETENRNNQISTSQIKNNHQQNLNEKDRSVKSEAENTNNNIIPFQDDDDDSFSEKSSELDQIPSLDARPTLTNKNHLLPPSPNRTLQELKRQRQEARLSTNYGVPSSNLTQYDSSICNIFESYEAPPSPTMIRYKFKMNYSDHNVGKNVVKKKKKCCIQ